MEGVSWSISPHPEAFKRPKATAEETLNRLASFIARVESKQGKTCKQLSPPPLQPMLDDGVLPFSCHECFESFPCAGELLTHQDSHHALPKLHRCLSCGTSFSLRSSLELHNCDFSSDLFPAPTRSSPSFATSVIPDDFFDALELDEPRLLDRFPYTCAPCGKGFMLKQALLHHQQAGCDSAASPLRRLDESSLASEEDSCSSNSLYNPDGESVNKCCSRTFRTEAAFRRHIRAKHLNDKDTDSNGETKVRAKKRGVFSCRSCDMVFTSTAKLSKHRKDKHARTPGSIAENLNPGLGRKRYNCKNHTYTCQICSQVFFHHISLWTHKQKHSKLGRFATPNDATKDRTLIKKPKTSIKLTPKLLNRKSALTKAASVVKKYPGKFHKSRKFPVKNLTTKRVDVPKEEEEPDSEGSEFPCPSCPEVFSRLAELKAHSELHQSAMSRGRCSVCASDMDSLLWPGAKRLRLYHCIICQSGFTTLEPFLQHCQDHLKAKVDEET